MAAPSTPASMIRCTTGMFFGPSSRAIASERRTRPQVSTRFQIAISVAAGKTIHDTNIGTSSGPTCTGHCFSARVAVDNQRRSAGASKALPVVVNLSRICRCFCLTPPLAVRGDIRPNPKRLSE